MDYVENEIIDLIKETRERMIRDRAFVQKDSSDPIAVRIAAGRISDLECECRGLSRALRIVRRHASIAVSAP